MGNNNILKIEIKNQDPVDLNVLAISLNSFAQLYDDFLLKNSDNVKLKKEERKLLVQEVKKGSIIIEIVSVLATVSHLFEFDESLTFDAILEFGKYLSNMSNFFSKKEEQKYDFSKKDSENFSNVVDVISRDSNGNMNVNISDNQGKIIINNVVNLSTMEANATQNVAREYARLKESNSIPSSFSEKLLKLVITEKNVLKGIISDIHAKEKKLILDPDIKSVITNDQSKPFAVYYLVNGKVIIDREKDKIIAYKIDYIIDTIEDDN
jgi:hypothetical protein